MSSDDGQLELIALRRHFGDTVALDGLTFTVPRGQVFGFLGPNGPVARRPASSWSPRSGSVPASQVAVSAAITVASTVWMARLAGTIYERAIIRTGSRLKVRQVLRSAA